MELEGPKRPNALIIYDDNLTDHVIAGLLRAGVRVPDELMVVTHANFPLPPGGDFPLTRIGFDCRQLLLQCLNAVRAGSSKNGPIGVPLVAQMEHELNPVYSTV
jgi:DNA-binding LacI/PurR family transcriptional regulator